MFAILMALIGGVLLFFVPSFVFGENSEGARVDPKAMKNWAIINNRADSHINALAAWKIQTGSNKIKVAVIDTGVDATHPDLRPNIWRDESGNYGWDFVTGKPNPKDDHGHGTIVAGIIGAIVNPRTGVAGVAHHVSIMAAKYYSEANPGSVNLKNTVNAIRWAVANGANIINYSGGGPEFSQEEYLAIKEAEAKGVLFVAAAGNERQDTDVPENYYYPAAYKLTNIVVVTAMDINNKLLRSSNWGQTKVDVAAPGENIYSTLPDRRYGYMTGTSQATAVVTGVAVLILSQNPSLKPAQVRDIIRESCDPKPELRGKVACGGSVNALTAVKKAGSQ
jgi:thermitase